MSGISKETRDRIDHYRAVAGLLGEEDNAVLKKFLDWFVEEIAPYRSSTTVDQGIGLLANIIDPEGIAEEDEGFLDGDETEEVA